MNTQVKTRLQVGVTAFGSAVRGIFASEMAHSNSAVLDSQVFKILAEVYNAEFFILKPMLVASQQLLDQKKAEGDEYANRFTVCASPDEYPAALDLIVSGQGSENLMLTGNFAGLTMTHAFSYFSTLSKFPTTPVFALQTDFATPLQSPEAYGSIFIGLFPDLFKFRKITVVPMGVEPDNRDIFIAGYPVNEFCSHIHRHTSVDQQFIVNSSNVFEDLPVVEVPLGIAFAGKARIKGDRSGQLVAVSGSIKKYLMLLIGQWKTEYIDNAIAANPQLSKTAKYFKHNDVLREYNKYGFTIYISCEAYRNVKTITSRFSDAIRANCLPLIWHEEVATFKHYFHPSLIDELTVTPETVEQVMDNWEDPIKRADAINYFREQLEINRQTVYGELIQIISDTISGQLRPEIEAESTTREITECDFYRFVTTRPRARLNKERADELVKDRLKYLYWSFDDLIKAEPYQVKVATGLYYNYRNKDSWEDVPQAVIDKIKTLL